MRAPSGNIASTSSVRLTRRTNGRIQLDSTLALPFAANPVVLISRVGQGLCPWAKVVAVVAVTASGVEVLPAEPVDECGRLEALCSALSVADDICGTRSFG